MAIVYFVSIIGTNVMKGLVRAIENGTKRYLRSLKKSIQEKAAADESILQGLYVSGTC